MKAVIFSAFYSGLPIGLLLPRRSVKAITRARYLLAAPLFVAVSGVLADDFKTVNGKEYKNATVSRVEPDGIVIKFSGGIVKIPFTALSQDLQKKYHYDPGAAASYAAADVAAQQRFAQEQAEQQQRAAAEDAARKRAAGEEVIKKNAHTLREVRSDQLSFLDKPFLTEGRLSWRAKQLGLCQ